MAGAVDSGGAKATGTDARSPPAHPRRIEIPFARRPRVAVDLRAVVRPPSGIGVHTLELTERLARSGELDVVGLAHRRPVVAERLEDAGVRIEVQPAPLGVVWQQLHLPRRLAAGDLDLLWSPLQTLPSRLPIPAVVTVHDLAVLLWPETLSWKIRWSQLPFLGRSLESASRIVAVSHATARDLAAAFPSTAARTEVIWNGVGPEWSPAPDAEVAATRERLGAPRGYYLSVGTLEPRKNLDLLLDAWETLHEEEPETALPLLLAGAAGWKNRRLRARLEALSGSGVRHLGRLDPGPLRELVRAATAFVYPSLYEGFGLPVAEAMACAVPVVVGDTSSLPEVAGDGGLVVEPERADALVEALHRLASEPGLAAELGRRGRERARRYSWDDGARRLAEIFAEVVAGSAERE